LNLNLHVESFSVNFRSLTTVPDDVISFSSFCLRLWKSSGRRSSARSDRCGAATPWSDELQAVTGDLQRDHVIVSNILHDQLPKKNFISTSSRERADSLLVVLLIQTIVFISFYLPPGHSVFASGVEARRTHCLLVVRLICLRTVLLTDACLVLFSF